MCAAWRDLFQLLPTLCSRIISPHGIGAGARQFGKHLSRSTPKTKGAPLLDEARTPSA